MQEAGSTLGIHVLDHIIVARDGETSVQQFLEKQ
jgi:DNA repair protein RadC